MSDELYNDQCQDCVFCVKREPVSGPDWYDSAEFDDPAAGCALSAPAFDWYGDENKPDCPFWTEGKMTVVSGHEVLVAPEHPIMQAVFEQIRQAPDHWSAYERFDRTSETQAKRRLDRLRGAFLRSSHATLALVRLTKDRLVPKAQELLDAVEDEQAQQEAVLRAQGPDPNPSLGDSLMQAILRKIHQKP